MPKKFPVGSVYLSGLFITGGLRGGKMGIDGKMHYNPGWESGSMKTLAAHGYYITVSIVTLCVVRVLNVWVST
jgi:hypothetical protein